MKKPYLSIILLTFNGEQYLNRCINSIISQTFRNFELIIIDDGSSDNTLNIISGYEKNDSRVVCKKYSHGRCLFHLNEGIKNARGELIFQIDQDDFISETFLENMIHPFNDFQIDSVLCSYTYIDCSEHKLNWYTPDLRNINPKSGKDAAIFFLTKCYLVEGFRWNKITRKKVFIENKLEYKDTYPPDLIFKLDELFNCNKVYILDEHGYFYRQHSKSDIASLNFNRNIVFFNAYKIIKCRARMLNLAKEGDYFYLDYTIKKVIEMLKTNYFDIVKLKSELYRLNLFSQGFFCGIRLICLYSNKYSRFRAIFQYLIVYFLVNIKIIKK